MTTPYDLPIAQHLHRLWPEEFKFPYIQEDGTVYFIVPYDQLWFGRKQFTLSDDATCWSLLKRFGRNVNAHIMRCSKPILPDGYIKMGKFWSTVTNESFAKKLNEMLEGLCGI